MLSMYLKLCSRLMEEILMLPNEVTMIYNPGFTTFKTSPELQTKLAGFSPLQSPYGDYNASPSAQILAYQRIGKVDTQFPLILMGETNDRRTCVITGEGIWKWQLYDQLQNGSKEITHELINQLCQYTSTKSDKRKFRVSTPKKLFTELEDITFQAELYNDNYELINTPDVLLKIRNGEGEEFEYNFNTTGEEYALSIGRFQNGNYSYSASTELNGIKQVADGKICGPAGAVGSLVLHSGSWIIAANGRRIWGQSGDPG
jgi:hypothetical protein